MWKWFSSTAAGSMSSPGNGAHCLFSPLGEHLVTGMENFSTSQFCASWRRVALHWVMCLVGLNLAMAGTVNSPSLVMQKKTTVRQANIVASPGSLRFMFLCMMARSSNVIGSHFSFFDDFGVSLAAPWSINFSSSTLMFQVCPCKICQALSPAV